MVLYILIANSYKIFKNTTTIQFHLNSRDSEDLEDTQGNRATAWLQHGVSPIDASYAYIINVKTSPLEMKQLSEDMSSDDKPFEVLKQDREAHIVKSKSTQTTSYVLFEKLNE